MDLLWLNFDGTTPGSALSIGIVSDQFFVYRFYGPQQTPNSVLPLQNNTMPKDWTIAGWPIAPWTGYPDYGVPLHVLFHGQQ